MRKKTIILMLVAMMSMAASAQSSLKKVYDEEANQLWQIDNAIEEAAKSGKFVVCQVGGNWCVWCLRFADFITTDNDIKQIVDDNFVYIHVNYNPKRSEGEEKMKLAEQMLKRLGNPQRFGFPVFVVLNSNGEVIHTQDSSFLEEGKGYDKEKVLRFFKNWTPKAVSEGKK